MWHKRACSYISLLTLFLPNLIPGQDVRRAEDMEMSDLVQEALFSRESFSRARTLFDVLERVRGTRLQRTRNAELRWKSSRISRIEMSPVNQRTASTFELASYYASNMVLQRPPVKPRIWGYAVNVGDQIVLELVNGSQKLSVNAVAGPEGRPIWEAVFQPITPVGPHTITVQSGSSVITLTNVLIGDVWFCSGQSNMQFEMDKIDNAKPELEDVVNYPSVRTFFASLVWSDTPLIDLKKVERNWALPTPDNIAPFSAVCWLFGRNLYRKYGRPIGLIENNWGGTRIEAWSSPSALATCYKSVPPSGPPNGASQLYNAMIHPFIPMPIFGAIWYQGEANAGLELVGGWTPEYSCAVKAMVTDWRNSWFALSPEMDREFAFGEVQLAPWRNEDLVAGFPDIRWAQTGDFGYMPNKDMRRDFVAVTIDLPDFSSPYGAIHPRFKRQVAERLALSAFNVAYSSNDTGIFQGPLPVSYAREAANVRVTYDVDLYFNTTYSENFELCCGSASTNTCASGGRWVATLPIKQETRAVSVTNVCKDGESVTGFRYLWRESPCLVLEQCPIYSKENRLPAPPYIYSGLIG